MKVNGPGATGWPVRKLLTIICPRGIKIIQSRMATTKKKKTKAAGECSAFMLVSLHYGEAHRLEDFFQQLIRLGFPLRLIASGLFPLE